MLRVGIIEESYSPWYSLVIGVPKPNGSLTLCNDFHRPNAVSEFDSDPLP